MNAVPPSQVRDPWIRNPVADWHRADIAHSGASAGDFHPTSFEADGLMCANSFRRVDGAVKAAEKEKPRVFGGLVGDGAGD
jgi:hypothetical protein